MRFKARYQLIAFASTKNKGDLGRKASQRSTYSRSLHAHSCYVTGCLSAACRAHVTSANWPLRRGLSSIFDQEEGRQLLHEESRQKLLLLHVICTLDDCYAAASAGLVIAALARLGVVAKLTA